MGEQEPAEEDDEVVSYVEASRGVYKKLVVRDNRLVGAIVIGDGATVPSLLRVFSDSTPVPDDRAELLFRALAVAPVQPEAVPDAALICNCNGVTKAQIIEAVLGGARSLRRRLRRDAREHGLRFVQARGASDRRAGVPGPVRVRHASTRSWPSRRTCACRPARTSSSRTTRSSATSSRRTVSTSSPTCRGWRRTDGRRSTTAIGSG